jgi:hypothetical protein
LAAVSVLSRTGDVSLAKPVSTTKLDLADFQPQSAAKVRRLLLVLDRLSKHPFLGKRVCLHGGTALNLFFLDLPRLSVDLDLNYVGSSDRAVMLEERPALEKAVFDIAKELGYTTTASNPEHSGRSIKLHYTSQFGADLVKIDLDYLNRSPLLPVEKRAVSIGNNPAVAFPINSSIELIGGKIKALLSRVVPRDLYDAYRISEIYPALLETSDQRLLRRALLYYSALSDPFPRPFVVAGRFAGRERELEDILYPMLKNNERPTLDELLAKVDPFIAEVTKPVDDCEVAFMENAAKAVFAPSLLFEEYPLVLEAANNDPAAKWKIQNLAKSN